MTNTQKLLLIGIDGATFAMIKPLMEQGKLPNFSRLMETGVHGVLASTVPPVSPVAWTSLMTGMHPGKHGIFDFAGKIPGSYDFKMNTAADRRARPFWMHLSDAGKRVLVLGVTMTYPPDPVNGYMVSGLGMPPTTDISKSVYPPEFADMVLSVGPYRAVPEGDLRKLFKSDGEKDRFLRGVMSQIDERVRLFREMWKKERFDFSFVFFLDTDGVSHYFWKYMESGGAYSDAIFTVYQKVDQAIGELVETVGSDAGVMLVSDHGFGPLRKVVFLNNWLEAEGYLRFGKPDLLAWFRSGGRRPEKAIDWPGTKAYFKGTIGNIFINLKGREPRGTVEPADYAALCDTIRAGLLGLRDPDTGEQVVHAVYQAGDLGTREVPGAPDLVLTFKRGYSVVGDESALQAVRDTGAIIADSNNWSGNHEPDGILIAQGAGFKRGSVLEDAAITDIAPTSLYFFGLPIPEAMDGRVLDGLFEGTSAGEARVLYRKDDGVAEAAQPGLTKKESDLLVEQLRNLGYLE
jgi:predicted AlkP superfamily phosphohydrolase/phosphomutase